MSEATDDFLDLLRFSLGIIWYLRLHRVSVPRFEEWCSGLTSFSSNAALPKSVITHRAHFTLLVEEDCVIYSACNLLNIFQALNERWRLINHKLTPDLCSGFTTK